MSRVTAADWQYVKRCSPHEAYRDLLRLCRRRLATKVDPGPARMFVTKWYRRVHTQFVIGDGS